MSAWMQVLGWTLIHFVWQGAVIAVAAAGVLRLCRRRSPETRYVVACVALTAMLASAAGTAATLEVRESFLPPGSAIGPAFAGRESAAADPGSVNESAFGLGSQTEAVRMSVDTMLPAIVWLWLAGVTLLLARFTGGCWRVQRLRAASVTAGRSRWQVVSERLAHRLRVTAAFEIVESPLVGAPTVIGWLRPVVLLPVAVLSSMPPGQIEALIAHELAHIKRRDYAVNLLQTVAEALLFFHPAVWWISHRIRQEREHCCDDAAVAVCGEPEVYAEALAALAASSLGSPALSVGAAKGSLVSRIRRLIDLPENDEAPAFGAVAAIGLGVGCAVAMLLLQAPQAAAQPAASGSTRTVRQTDHFEIHYAPALDLHADRAALEAERAYERVSNDLRHNLASKVAIVLFENTAARERGARETVGDQAGHRLLLAIDRPADQWLGLLTHELTHVFSFDIIPGSATPGWIMEGLAEYERGAWDPSELVTLREAVRSNTVPSLAALSQTGAHASPSLDTLGHAVFDFIESRWGKAGIRQFLLALRQSALGGGDPYVAAFQIGESELNQGFERYLRGRFSAAAQADRFDRTTSRRLDGSIVSVRYPVPAGLACLELILSEPEGNGRRWGIECGAASADDLIRALKPGDRVIVTGAPARLTDARRLLIASLARPSDGYTWGVQAR